MAAAAFIVDVTRIASRLGRGALTGIDRVELAYIQHIPRSGRPALALLRTKAGVMLLSTDALCAIDAWAGGAPIPQTRDLLARLTRRQDPGLGRVETALRRFAIARAPMPLLAAMLRRKVPANTVYLNTGHANLTARMMQALHTVPGLRIVVLVHDTIPLDHPKLSRLNQISAFEGKMEAVSAHADLVLHTAHTTRQTTEAQLSQFGRIPPGLVAPLGVEVARPNPSALPPRLDLTAPYFVTVGTIEPRKNHALLLDVWEKLAERGPVPSLFILGNRGWAAQDLFARLDRGVKGVTVLPGLGDGAMAALVAGARALLFPSRVEGFGLPPYEAAAVGTPVLSTPLSVILEGLGDYPVYLDADDSYSWMETIIALTLDPEGGKTRKIAKPPQWCEHFKTVLKSL